MNNNNNTITISERNNKWDRFGYSCELKYDVLDTDSNQLQQWIMFITTAKVIIIIDFIYTFDFYIIRYIHILDNQ